MESLILAVNLILRKGGHIQPPPPSSELSYYYKIVLYSLNQGGEKEREGPIKKERQKKIIAWLKKNYSDS